MPLITVCAAWGVFWGSWAALLPAVKEQLGASTAELGLALIGTPVGAIPVMALAGGRERPALLASAVASPLLAALAAWLGLPAALAALGLLAVPLLLVGTVPGRNMVIFWADNNQ